MRVQLWCSFRVQRKRETEKANDIVTRRRNVNDVKPPHTALQPLYRRKLHSNRRTIFFPEDIRHLCLQT